ncbi:MAG: ATP-dependent RNA helicase HrpA [Chitinispirillales bacterium]|jgi:ATP-dependent helicase HrpA|nr:ATP-dependent RNA helicase HrpA [Chitinispirillales bacterium]
MNTINSDLPIFEKRGEIITSLKENQVIVVCGQTGSGKTTQLPLFCLEAGLGIAGKIGCTQPRRIAATSIAARVASQLGCELGGEVGYKIRFTAKESHHTRVKFMTDGILLAETEHDRQLLQYDTIIIDEAHERSLNIDLLLGYLRKLLPKRPDLKVIISSATIDSDSFSKNFDNAPIIEVSGRLFPIEVLYREPLEEDDESGYVENAVEAVSDILDEYGAGDMLVFMPSERDIRETCDKLQNIAKKRDIEVLPLFSRLTRAQQEQIFHIGEKARIVVCTNIAETSITVPNIRYVVDTGLSRVSRYAPRLRTNRLPIEPVSRASADQRKGRCGRVQDGVCVRLYSEDEYLQRDSFTQPEIKRSNLAGVILTMAARGLGAVEDFPFIEAPSKQAVSEGYAKLKELGALDKQLNLTKMGREMARFPFDPHISRMVIAGHKENALREVKIIAAALSIVDPRERPFDKQAEADRMHGKFIDKGSDFITYVNLWNAFQSEWKTIKTQGGMRRFCKEHFLSYTRMREWHDVHQQLDETLSQMGDYRENNTPAPYASIHRALLTGLLDACAYFDKNSTKKYKAARGREVIIFPGSALAKKKCNWIMCHQIVETSNIFARTVAAIEPEWIEELAGPLCSRSFETPFFDSESGTVKATERVMLFGMPVAVRKNALYSRAAPEHASEIFIRDGLIDENLVCHHSFYKHNHELKEKISRLEEKIRSRTLYKGDESLFTFYKERLGTVSSIHELNKLIKTNGNDKFLLMKETDIMDNQPPPEAQNFPDYVRIGNKNFALKYAFEPGHDNDGVTLTLPQNVLPFIEKNSLGWLVPALWPETIKDLLRQLPRERRKTFIPVNEAALRLSQALVITDEPFSVSLSKTIQKVFGVTVDPCLLDQNRAAPHLNLKLDVQDEKGKTIARGQGSVILKQMENLPAQNSGSPWEKTFNSYRKTGLANWPNDALNEPVDIGSQTSGISVRGYPALVPNDNSSIDLVLYPSKEQSDAAHKLGVTKLLEMSIGKDLSWAERDLSFSNQMKIFCSPFGKSEDFKQKLYEMICNNVLDFSETPRTEDKFNTLILKTQEKLRGAGFRTVTVFEESLKLFTENMPRISTAKKRIAPDLFNELESGLKKFFTDILEDKVPLDLFLQYPRYLKAFAPRIEKAICEPAKYRQKSDCLRFFETKLNLLRTGSPRGCPITASHAHTRLINELSQMIREFEISLFAQHIKTLYPISEKRLYKKLEEIEKLQ